MKKIVVLLVLTILFSCKEDKEARKPLKQVTVEGNLTDMGKNLGKYVPFKLTSDLSVLTDNERKMLPLLIKAADKMNALFWFESYGDKEVLMAKIPNEDSKKFVEINYGPWDRLAGNASFVEGIGAKPAGANYYPADITKEEFEAAVSSLHAVDLSRVVEMSDNTALMESVACASGACEVV